MPHMFSEKAKRKAKKLATLRTNPKSHRKPRGILAEHGQRKGTDHEAREKAAKEAEDAANRAQDESHRGGVLPEPSRPGDPESEKRQKKRDAELAAAAASKMFVGTYYLIQPTSDSDIDSAASFTGMLTGFDDKTATFDDLRNRDGKPATRDNTFDRNEYSFYKVPKPASNGGRRRRTRRRSTVIRMKKGEYLREHHHLFRVLRNPTRRALNAELRAQQRELKERGLKG